MKVLIDRGAAKQKFHRFRTLPGDGEIRALICLVNLRYHADRSGMRGGGAKCPRVAPRFGRLHPGCAGSAGGRT